MFINILINSAVAITVFTITQQILFPVLTRKEFEDRDEIVCEKIEECVCRCNELTERFDSLAKELGYEYVSEAVKINDDVGMTATEIDYRKKNGIGEKAVLLYSWKKIDGKAGFIDESNVEKIVKNFLEGKIK